MIEQQTTPTAPAEGKPKFSKAECERVATLIATQLGERNPQALGQLQRITKIIGPEQAMAFLQKTQEVEATGGMLTIDGSRRRTPGGAFFYLLYGKYPRLREHPQQKRKRMASQPATANNNTTVKQEQPTTNTLFSWADRIAALDEIGIQKGTITTVKITLIGRPGKIVDRGTCIITSMKATKTPMLPKGVPAPSTFQTNYVVYIAAKQWRTVAESIKDEEDSLIVEGFPQLDPETSSIAVFATNTTTKKLQAAKRKPEQ